MGIEPRFQGIPHTASTVTITFSGAGAGWQGGIDESWAIENLDVRVGDVEDIPIDLGAGDQYDPHVDGNLISYTSGAITIRYFRYGVDSVPSQVPTVPDSADTLSDVSGTRIAFSREFANGVRRIMTFQPGQPAPVEVNPPSMSTTVVTRYGAAIGGDTVAYVDYDLHGAGEIVAWDLATSTAQRLTTDNDQDQNPQVSHDGTVIVWEHCPAANLADCNIYQAVRGSSGWTVSVASADPATEQNPDTNGTIVAYDSSRASATDPDIYFRPVAGGAETQLAIAGPQANPAVAGVFIAFESGTPSDLMLYDTAQNLLFQVTNTSLVNESLNDITVLPTGEVLAVYATDEDGQFQRNIRAKKFRVPPSGLTLTGCPATPVPLGSAVTVTVAFDATGLGGTFLLGSTTDGGSPQVVTPGPLALYTGIPGSHTLTVTASEQNVPPVRGPRIQTVTCDYFVAYYDFIEQGGFLEPIADDQLNIVKAGSTVAVKWRLGDGAGGFVSDLAAVISIGSRGIDCSGLEALGDNPVNAEKAGASGLHYDAVAQQFVFNWKTDRGWAKTCREIVLSLADGSTYSAPFQFK